MVCRMCLLCMWFNPFLYWRRIQGVPLHAAVKTENAQYLAFLDRLLSFDPNTRLTPSEALQHEWMVSNHTNRPKVSKEAIWRTYCMHDAWLHQSANNANHTTRLNRNSFNRGANFRFTRHVCSESGLNNDLPPPYLSVDTEHCCAAICLLHPVAVISKEGSQRYSRKYCCAFQPTATATNGQKRFDGPRESLRNVR